MYQNAYEVEYKKPVIVCWLIIGYYSVQHWPLLNRLNIRESSNKENLYGTVPTAQCLMAHTLAVEFFIR
jgi:hypothetical protein